MFDAWFANAIAPDGDTTDGCHPDEARALQSYLENQTTVAQAAETITKPVAASQDPDDNVHRLYGLLLDALLELPASTTAPLLDLLRAIEDLPASGPCPGPHERLVTAHGLCWRGLSNFGHFWSDGATVPWYWSESAGRSLPASGNQDMLVTQSVRRTEVEAWMALRGLAGIPLGWGYECVTDALERSQAALDTEVPMACAWLLVAGDQFRKGAQEGESSWALNRKGDLWMREENQKPIMTMERWDFWIRRLKEIANNDAISSRTREAAGQCAIKVYLCDRDGLQSCPSSYRT
ncbi:hypothetical protein PG990_002474 [Apiospora arundinis]